MGDRVILHCDLDNFFASVECTFRPELRDVPMAVCGSESDRHGIVLAKNQLAKKAGVKPRRPSGRRARFALNSSACRRIWINTASSLSSQDRYI